MPCEASAGAHAAAGPSPPPEPANAMTAGNGPGPGGRANSPQTPGSRISDTVAPGASQSRSVVVSAVCPPASACSLALTGDGELLADGATRSPDHHSPKGSTPV